MELISKEVSQTSASSVQDGGERQSAGKPPLPPFKSRPGSRTSSLTSSPRDYQAQSSVHALSKLKLAQYRAGARIFKEDRSAKSGLNSGDVVGFRSKEGRHVVKPLPSENDDTTAAHFRLDAVHSSLDDDLAHLEVVKQGKWYAFRSAAAEDRFLQARKRNPRMVFFNTNIGTWEQWELAQPESVEDGPWAQKTVTFKHRRLSQFEIEVELIRLGNCTLLPNASMTSRSIVTAPTDTDLTENVQLRKMSGVVMHEWFNFVDREKQLRMNIAAQVAQLVEDAADLKAWTVSQVDSIRGEMDEEVTLLLDTIQCKSEKLDDTTARLTARLRWGIAVLQAKNELRIKRQVFSTWRGLAARKKYCRNVLARLTARADMRFIGRMWSAWFDRLHEQRALRQKLWHVVKRVAASRMHQTFISWQQVVAAKKQAAAKEQRLAALTSAHMQKWRMQQGLSAWRNHARRCHHAREMLERMGRRVKQQSLLSAFTAWRGFLPRQQLRVESLQALVLARRRHVTLEQTLTVWRQTVDIKQGQRLQLAQAERMLNRLRQQYVLQAWHNWHRSCTLFQQKFTRFLSKMQQCHLRQTFDAWREEAAFCRNRRELLMRFVSERAVGMIKDALDHWRGYTALKRERTNALKELIVRKSTRLLSIGFNGWKHTVSERRIQKHRIAICQRRQASRVLHTVLAGWRAWLARKRAKDIIVELGQKRNRRNRLAAAVQAFAANVQHQTAKRQQIQAVVQLSVWRLQKTMLRAWISAVHRAQQFEQQLLAVGKAMQVQQTRNSFQGWHAATQAKKTDKQKVAHAQHMLGKLRLQAALHAWRGYCSHTQFIQDQLRAHVERSAVKLVSAAFTSWRVVVIESRSRTMRMWQCTMRISQLRMAWAFRVWQHLATKKRELRQAVNGAKRRMDRIKLAGALKAWRQQGELSSQARIEAEKINQARNDATLQRCFSFWIDYRQQQYDRQAAIMGFVQRRATLRLANVIHFWRAYVQHMATRRQQLQRACSKLRKVRLQQALEAWHQIAQEQQMLTSLCKGVMKRLQANVLARCFTIWLARSRYKQQLRQKAATLESRTRRKQLERTFSLWHHDMAIKRHARCMLGKLARRTDSLLLAGAFQAWRQHVPRAQHLQRLEYNMTSKRQQAQVAACFKAWSQHTERMHATRAAINSKHSTAAAVVLRLSLRSWKGHVSKRQTHRVHILERCIDKKVSSLQSKALQAWRQHTQARLRSEAVMLRAVDRLAMRMMRSAFATWHTAARARVARRTAIARFINRWQQQRMRMAFWHWQDVLEERKAALDNLRWCLTRKRVAFKLFRNWYWESFDDEMQETLRTMFEVANEAANDPLPSRMGSPISSLLSSPIRAQLAHAPHHHQLAAGVAQRLSDPGGLQPAYLRMGQASRPEGQVPDRLAASLHMQLGSYSGVTSLRQPLPPQAPPLRSRVTSSRSSPVKPSYMPAPGPNLGGATLAPLRDYAETSLAHSASYALHDAAQAGSVHSEAQAQHSTAAWAQLDAGQHEWQAVSPYPKLQAETSVDSQASGVHSKVASTVVPRSPLTPTSDSYTGNTPMTHFGTPNPDGMFTVSQVPGTVLGSARKAQHNLESAERWQTYGVAESRLRVSPVGSTDNFMHATSPYRSPTSLSDAPTPGAGMFREYNSPPGQGTPMSKAGTPMPGTSYGGMSSALVDEPTPQPYLHSTAGSPALRTQQLTDAATPLPDGGVAGLQGRYQMKRMSSSGEVHSTLQTQFYTPQGSRKNAAMFPELQGNYSMRRMSAATQHELHDFEEQDTPNPNHFIPAFLGTIERMDRLSTEEEMNAAKTPFYVNPMCFDSPSKFPSELD